MAGRAQQRLGGQRKQVVRCAAEFASMAQRGGRDTDPRVTRAISLVEVWAESEADALDLLAAECDALDAAREWARSPTARRNARSRCSGPRRGDVLARPG